MNKLFEVLDLESCSSCNRTCSTCIRNSHPDREKMAPWFKTNYMPMKWIRKAMGQLVDMEYKGQVCISHYNEPLLDIRLPEIAKICHAHFFTFCNSNGDFLNEELAKSLDGYLDRLIISLYMNEPIKSKRAEWIKSLFHKTEIVVNTATEHIVTHFSPRPELQTLIEQNQGNLCLEPKLHCIINHRGQFLLCCDDVIGNFGLEKFPETSIEDYWYGDKHMAIYDALKLQGGRKSFPYCMSCPRG